MMRLLFALIVLAIVFGVWSIVIDGKNSDPTFGPPTISFESLNQLVTGKVMISDIITAEKDSYKGIWVIKGDAMISIDLSEVRPVASPDNTVRITLPSPRVIQPRLDHEQTLEYDVTKQSWMPWKGSPETIRQAVFLAGQKRIEQIANSKEYLDPAKTEAECAIKAIYEAVGWNAVIEWSSVTGHTQD